MKEYRLIIVGEKAIDWPANFPIPAHGDVVAIEDLQGNLHRATVDNVHYLVTKTQTEIRIETDPIY